MTMLRTGFTAVLLFAMLAGDAAAQQPAGWLTVKDALELAEQNSPALGRLRAEIDAKSGERLASYGVHAPQVSYAREGIPTGGGDYNEQRWVVAQSIDFPLETYYRLKRVGTESGALSLGLEAARRDLRSRVKTAYTEVLYAQELLHLGLQGVELGESLKDAVAAQVAVGAAAELDEMKIDLQLSEARSTLEERLRLYEDARYSLYQVIGIDPGQQVYGVVFPDTMAYLDVEISQEDVIALLPGQPELVSADETVRAARILIQEKRSAALPQLHINYWPQDFGNGYRYRAFEVGFTVPLWFALNNRGAIQQARAREQYDAWNRQDIQLGLKRDIERAWHGYQTSKLTIDRYADTVQALADDLLARTREGYQLGQLDLLTLLDTQRTYLAAQARYYEALRNYYVNLVQLERFLQQDLVFVD
ncbi:MAG: TolC family protein [Rhodothermales bacterium]